MVDGSEKRKCQLASELQSSRVFQKRSKSMRFRVNENALIDSRPNYNFDAFSTIHTKTFENDSDRIIRCDVSGTLCAYYKHTRLRYFRSPFSFSYVFDRQHQHDMYAFSF